MCGRFALPDEDEVGAYWQIVRCRCRGWFTPQHNVAPTAQVPIVVKADDGALELQAARWGLIPRWWQKNAAPTLTFNVRCEDAARKPLWRESLRNSRCLMPARGWYEWNAKEPMGRGSGRPGKQPYFIRCPDAKVIAFAGLWSVWDRPGAGPVASCALLTKPAAPGIAAIHPRMPVVLKPNQEAAWLDPATPPDGLDALVAGAREDLRGHPVGPRVNGIRNDSPELMDRIQTSATGTLDFDASGV